jgi:hypothetical protein
MMDPITHTLIALMAHHTPTLKPYRGTSCIYLGLSTDQCLLFWVFRFKENLISSVKEVSKGSLSPLLTASQNQLQFRTSYHSPFPGCSASCKFVDLKRSDLWFRVRMPMTYVSCDTRLKCFRGVISNPFPVLSNVPSDRTRRICCRFFFNKHPDPSTFCHQPMHCSFDAEKPSSKLRYTFHIFVYFSTLNNPLYYTTRHTSQEKQFTWQYEPLLCTVLNIPKPKITPVAHTVDEASETWRDDEIQT